MKQSEWVIILYFCYSAVNEVGSFLNTDEDHKLFTLFRKVYHKKYCKDEFYRRMYIFEKALKRIALHNFEFDMGLYTYRRGVNKYSDLTHKEFISGFNGFLGTPECRKNRTTRKTRVRRSLPEISYPMYPMTLDYRDQDLVAPVKDQLNCGCCWAFSAVASLESQTMKVTNQTVQLSEQNLLDCSSGNMGCLGGQMTEAFDYIIRNGGIERERSYPYEAMEGVCRFRESNIGAICTDYAEIDSGNEDDLMNALVNIGPISIGIDASLQSFQDYKGGIYDDPNCSSANLNHAILLIGYGTEDGIDYWLVKNSYGTSWGENGFARMVRNKNNRCGLATQACYPIVIPKP